MNRRGLVERRFFKVLRLLHKITRDPPCTDLIIAQRKIHLFTGSNQYQTTTRVGYHLMVSNPLKIKTRRNRLIFIRVFGINYYITETVFESSSHYNAATAALSELDKCIG